MKEGCNVEPVAAESTLRLGKMLRTNSAFIRVVLVLALTNILFIGTAVGDSWLEPKTTSYESADGAYKFTVFPKDGTDGSEKVDQKSEKPSSCVGRLERRVFLSFYHTVWERPLTNKIAPVSALVPRSGQYVVTFDNWGQVGYRPNVVAIYGADGQLIRQLALADFLSEEEISKLPRSVSSIWWGQGHYLSEDQGVVVLRVRPSEQLPMEQNAGMREIRVKLANGEVIPQRK
jgi:hypothetical protein